jgi:predicted RNase H-like HicB family nuclease
MNNSFKFKSVLLKDEDSYNALCLDIDVASDGDTIAKAKNNLQEAVLLYIESAIESNLPILRPVPIEENPINLRENDIVEIYTIKINFKVEAYA